MNEEVKNTGVKEEEQVKTWREVVFTPDMPLNVLVGSLNMINQRMCNLEDNTFIEIQEGAKVSLTDLYAAQTAEESKQEEVKEDKGE